MKGQGDAGRGKGTAKQKVGHEGERGQGAREMGSEDKNGKRARVDVVRKQGGGTRCGGERIRIRGTGMETKG